MVVRNLLILWTVVACLTSLSLDARSEPRGWLPDHEDKKLAREEELAASLSKQIEALPGVTSVQVRLRVSDDSLLSADRSVPSSVVVIVALRDEDPGLEDMVFALCRVPLPALSRKNFEYFARKDSLVAEELVWLGPVEMTRASRPRAVALVAGFLGTWILMAGVLIVVGTLRRIRKKRKAPLS